MIKVSPYHEYINDYKYVCNNNRASKYMKQRLTELKGKIQFNNNSCRIKQLDKR